MDSVQQYVKLAAVPPGTDGAFDLCPTVMTKDELIRFLPIGTQATPKLICTVPTLPAISWI